MQLVGDNIKYDNLSYWFFSGEYMYVEGVEKRVSLIKFLSPLTEKCEALSKYYC